MLISAQAFQAIHDRHAEEVRRLWKMNLDLIEKYHALKLQGANIPDPVPTLERKEIDPIDAAISLAAGKDKGLRAIMHKAATQALARGEDEMSIIKAIESGVDDNEGIPA